MCWKLVCWGKHACNTVIRPSHWSNIVQKQVMGGRSGWDRDTIRPLTRHHAIKITLKPKKHNVALTNYTIFHVKHMISLWNMTANPHVHLTGKLNSSAFFFSLQMQWALGNRRHALCLRRSVCVLLLWKSHNGAMIMAPRLRSSGCNCDKIKKKEKKIHSLSNRTWGVNVIFPPPACTMVN